MSGPLFKNYSLVRCDNVEKLNQILLEHGKIICRDSKLSKAVEIKFLDDDSSLDLEIINPTEAFKHKMKIEMIRKILEN